MLDEAVGAADLADWEHAADYDGIPFPPIPPEPAPQPDTREEFEKYEAYLFGEDADGGALPLDPAPTDPVRDRDLTLLALSMVTPDISDWGANGTGEPDTAAPARIETWDPSFPGQWRPLPAPAPRGDERGYIPPGGIL